MPSELVGAAYAARIVRIEPKAHGGADILVEFLPRPPEHTLRIALGEETIEIPLPPGVVDEPHLLKAAREESLAPYLEGLQSNEAPAHEHSSGSLIIAWASVGLSF